MLHPSSLQRCQGIVASQIGLVIRYSLNVIRARVIKQILLLMQFSEKRFSISKKNGNTIGLTNASWPQTGVAIGAKINVSRMHPVLLWNLPFLPDHRPGRHFLVRWRYQTWARYIPEVESTPRTPPIWQRYRTSFFSFSFFHMSCAISHRPTKPLLGSGKTTWRRPTGRTGGEFSFARVRRKHR